jgi:hypothetical protein
MSHILYIVGVGKQRAAHFGVAIMTLHERLEAVTTEKHEQSSPGAFFKDAYDRGAKAFNAEPDVTVAGTAAVAALAVAALYLSRGRSAAGIIESGVEAESGQIRNCVTAEVGKLPARSYEGVSFVTDPKRLMPSVAEQREVLDNVVGAPIHLPRPDALDVNAKNISGAATETLKRFGLPVNPLNRAIAANEQLGKISPWLRGDAIRGGARYLEARAGIELPPEAGPLVKEWWFERRGPELSRSVLDTAAMLTNHFDESLCSDVGMVDNIVSLTGPTGRSFEFLNAFDGLNGALEAKPLTTAIKSI